MPRRSAQETRSVASSAVIARSFATARPIVQDGAPDVEALALRRAPAVARQAAEQVRAVIAGAAARTENVGCGFDRRERPLELTALGLEPGARQEHVLPRLGLLDRDAIRVLEQPLRAAQIVVGQRRLAHQELGL